MPRPPNQREQPVSRATAKRFHKSRTHEAKVWDNNLQAKEQFNQPNKYWMGRGYNRSDVVGIDDIYTPYAYTKRGKKAQKQNKEEQKAYSKLTNEVIRENFAEKERPHLRKIEYRYSYLSGAAGQYNSSSNRITMDSRYVKRALKDKKAKVQFKEIMTHEMIHASRANDPNRPPYATRLKIPIEAYMARRGTGSKAGRDIDYEESQTEYETLARAKKIDRKGSYGYYSMIPKENGSGMKDGKKAKASDRKLATNKTKDGKNLPATGQYAYSSVKNRWPRSEIAGLKYKGKWRGKVELVDTYWKVDKRGQKAQYIHVTLNPDKKVSTVNRNYETNQAKRLNEYEAQGTGRVRVYHDGKLEKPGMPMSRRHESKPLQSPAGPGRGWHGQINKHRMAALKGHRRS